MSDGWMTAFALAVLVVLIVGGSTLVASAPYTWSGKWRWRWPWQDPK